MPLKKTQSTTGSPAVLVIESTKFQRRSLCRLIRAAGANQVAEALDTRDAERVLTRGRALEWIIVADPDLLGADAMQALKTLSDQFSVMGTLLLTHRRGAFDELREQAQHAGLTILTVLRKPVSAEEMGTLLRQFAQSANIGAARALVLSKDELSECLRAGNMRARFQPKVDLESGRPICCEALPYITHSRHGLVPAARFNQAIVQLGAQRVMTASVLRDAAELVRSLRDRDLDTLVAVSLGADVLCEHSDATSLDAYVRTLGISAADLVLEINATRDAIAEIAMADNLARLKLRGYRLVIKEDLPVASLSESAYAHFSEIKVRLVGSANGVATPDATEQLAALLVSARKHGLASCAVDIKAGVDLDQLRRTGFAFAQGDLISPSLTADEVLNWVAREEQARSFSNPGFKHHIAS